MLDFRRLEAFCKVYELQSFSKAGIELYLSQPTISAHVSALEKDLGVQLFDRLGRKIKPTAAGDVMFKYAQEAFSALDRGQAELQLLLDTVAGELVVGGSTIPAHYLLPELFAKFTQTYPDVNVSLKVGDTEDIITQVEAGQLAIGVVGAELPRPGLVYVLLVQDQLVIISSPSKAPELGTDELLPVSSLASQVWITRDSGSGTRGAFTDALSKAGVDPLQLRSAIEVESTQAVLQCARAGIGWAVTSRLAADPMIKEGVLVEVPVESIELSRQFFTVYDQRKHLFPVVKFFLSFLEHQFAGIPA